MPTTGRKVMPHLKAKARHKKFKCHAISFTLSQTKPLLIFFTFMRTRIYIYNFFMHFDIKNKAPTGAGKCLAFP